MKTSARNQFYGKIMAIKEGAVNSEVIIAVDGISLVAIITNASVAKLQLQAGKEVYALFKAAAVLLLDEQNIKTSARNQFTGTIKSFVIGAVNSEIVIDIGAGQAIVAMVTNQSAYDLDLKKDKQITAVVKASSIIVATSA